MNLASYIGQPHIKSLLAREIAQARTAALYRFPHVMLTGPGGLGKSRLAQTIADEIGGKFLHISDPKNLTSRRMTDFLMKQLPVDGYTKGGRPIPGQVYPIVCFCDEAHKARGLVETLYDPLQDFRLTINGDPSWLPYFTFIIATTDPDKLPQSFKERFPLQYDLEHYTAPDLEAMILAAFPAYNPAHARAVAQRSRRNARIALHLAERVIVHGLAYFELQGISDDGCRKIERAYLKILGEAHRPMSLGSIAARMQQKPDVIAGEIEPYLQSLGLINIGPEGRTMVQMGRGRGDR